MIPLHFSFMTWLFKTWNALGMGWVGERRVKLTVFTNLKYMKPGKMVFGRFALDFDSRRQVSRMSFHSTFKALKTATSNGWHKCVELGSRQMNRTWFVLHASIAFAEKCDPKLSPINTFLPGIYEATGKNCLETTNQTSSCQTIHFGLRRKLIQLDRF